MISAEVDLRMYFQVQNQSEVLGFSADHMKISDSWSQVQNYHQGVELVLAKISEYCRRKNKEIEKVNSETKLAQNQKLEVMKELDKYVLEQASVPSQLVQKFCLLLNEKKLKIQQLDFQL